MRFSAILAAVLSAGLVLASGAATAGDKILRGPAPAWVASSEGLGAPQAATAALNPDAAVDFKSYPGAATP